MLFGGYIRVEDVCFLDGSFAVGIHKALRISLRVYKRHTQVYHRETPNWVFAEIIRFRGYSLLLANFLFSMSFSIVFGASWGSELGQ